MPWVLFPFMPFGWVFALLFFFGHRHRSHRQWRWDDRHHGPGWGRWGTHDPDDDERPRPGESEEMRRARRRAAAETGFYAHLMTYASVITVLFVINILTWSHAPYARNHFWFLWPAFGWGIGIFSHFRGVFGQRFLRERFFERALERELRSARANMQTEKQASLGELSSTIAHEIRNPVAAAKSLVQQMGEDPTSVENVQYAKVALDELDRVERRISHLLKYAKEEDYQFGHVSLATVVDAALTQMKGKLDGAKVAAARNYIAGPTVNADSEKLKSVFVNIIDNAIDSFADVVEGRRLDLFIENGGQQATVRIRDNGRGIPPEKIDRIFNPFFTTKDHGTGLGMAIAKKIVEAHTGTIEVESKIGQGTEFQVTLPLPAK